MTFDEFARAHASGLLRLSYALCGDRGRAEDATQEALARVFTRWRKLDDPLPYARRVVINATRDTWRRVGSRETVGLPEEFDVPTDPLAALDDRALLLHALRRLPQGQRAVLTLRFWNDLSEADTARTLDISVGTVKSQTSRGLKALRSLLPLNEGQLR